jgi:hypothetical protein
MRIQKYLAFRADDINAPIFLCKLNQNLLEHASNSASISFSFPPQHEFAARFPFSLSGRDNVVPKLITY